MNPIRSYLNRRFLPSTRSATGSTGKSSTSLLGVLALCTAILAGSTPVYPATRTANAAPPTSNGDKMAPTETAEEAAALHHTLLIGRLIPDGEDATAITGTSAVRPPYYYGYWTAYPFTRKRLVALVAYYSDCAEAGPGLWYPWYPHYPPAYGQVSQGYVTGHLVNGACSGYIYRGRAIYYYWDSYTGSYHNDQFGAYWHYHSLYYYWQFNLLDR
jgi:hypothetical protein